MKTQLIKTKDKYILVSDEQPVKGWYFDTFINKVRNTSNAEYGVNDITKQIIAGIPVLPEIDFSLLSEEDCKTIGWVDVEKLALKQYPNNVTLFNNIQQKFNRLIWIDGFKKAQELNDKLFSLEDMRNMFILGGKHKVQNSDIFLDKMEEILQSLQQTEWDVEVDGDWNKEFYNLDDTTTPKVWKPKITNEKIKITKIL